MTTHSDERTSTYEVRAEPPTRHGRPALRTGLADGVLLLAGLYLILSPWVIHSTGQFGIAASNTITGLALALLATGFARSSGRLGSIAWVTPVIGAWVIASPWAIFHGAGMVPMDIPAATALSTATWLSNVIAGAVVLLAGLGRTRS